MRPGVVGELQLAARLEVLQAPVELLVVGGRVVELTDQLVDPLLQCVALARRLTSLAWSAASARWRSSSMLGAQLVDRAVGAAPDRPARPRSERRTSSASLCAWVDRRGALLDLRSQRLDLVGAHRAARRGPRARAARASPPHRARPRRRRASRRGRRGPSRARRRRRRAVASASAMRSASCCLRLLHLASGRTPPSRSSWRWNDSRVSRTFSSNSASRSTSSARKEALRLSSSAFVGAELVLEHRRALLLVAERAQLDPGVVELAARAIEHRARRGRGRPWSAAARRASSRARRQLGVGVAGARAAIPAVVALEPSRSCGLGLCARGSSSRAVVRARAEVGRPPSSRSRSARAVVHGAAASRPARAARPELLARAGRARYRSVSTLLLRACGPVPRRGARAPRAWGRPAGARLSASSRNSCSSSSDLRYWSCSSASRSSAAVGALLGPAARLALLAEARLRRGLDAAARAPAGRDGAGRARPAAPPPPRAVARRRRRRDPAPTSIANKNIAFVFHGPAARGDGRVGARELDGGRAPHAGSEPQRQHDRDRSPWTA